MIPDDIKRKIDSDEYTLVDKILYGGIGYGSVCIPDELPNIVIAIVFPPFSIIWNWHLGIYDLWTTIKKFIICLFLTSLFYFPGLIYAINEISCRAQAKVRKEKYNKLILNS